MRRTIAQPSGFGGLGGTSLVDLICWEGAGKSSGRKDKIRDSTRVAHSEYEETWNVFQHRPPS